MRHRAAEDETARLDAGDFIDLHAGPGLHQRVHRAAEGACVAEHGGDVAEHDSGLGIVRDRADGVVQVEVGIDQGHTNTRAMGPFALRYVQRRHQF